MLRLTIMRAVAGLMFLSYLFLAFKNAKKAFDSKQDGKKQKNKSGNKTASGAMNQLTG
jgi:hypothetical protein